MQAKKPKLALFHEEEEEHERDAKPVAPIPLPTRMREDAPLLDEMKRIREDSKQLQEYLESRPSEPKPTDSVYRDKMPVESFGLAMLQGMGYRPGEESASRADAPHLLEGRPSLLGLGAKLLVPSSGRGKRAYIAIGSVCQIAGTHRFVLVRQTDGVPGLDMVKVMDSAGKELVLPRSELILQDLTRLPGDHPAHSVARQAEAAAAAAAAASSSSSTCWLRPNLHVRVCQERSKWYKKRAWIKRVNPETKTCWVEFDQNPGEGEEHEFKQRHLQTTVEVGKRALILVNNVNGDRLGVVEDKDKKRARVRCGGAAHYYDLDDVCEIKD